MNTIKIGTESICCSVNPEAVVELVHSLKPLICDEKKRHEIITKGVGDFVTGIDLAVQTLLSAELKKDYPEIDFMGEEQKERTAVKGRPCWILDPIDGTSNLIFDLRLSAVSLGLYDGKDMAFGVIYNPFSEETYVAARGQGAFLNGKPIHVQEADRASQCLVAFGTDPYSRHGKEAYFGLIQNVLSRSIDLRRFGSAALDLAFTASGRFGAYFEPNLKPWDFSAGILIVEEAGGVVTTMAGEKVFPLENQDVLAASPAVHAELLPLMRDYIGKRNNVS